MLHTVCRGFGLYDLVYGCYGNASMCNSMQVRVTNSTMGWSSFNTGSWIIAQPAGGQTILCCIQAVHNTNGVWSVVVNAYDPLSVMRQASNADVPYARADHLTPESGTQMTLQLSSISMLTVLLAVAWKTRVRFVEQV